MGRPRTITPKAEHLAATAAIMERPELTPDLAQTALDAIGGEGEEVVRVGTREIAEQLTEECPHCKADDSGGGVDEPPSAMSTCQHCIGGRVPKGYIPPPEDPDAA